MPIILLLFVGTIKNDVSIFAASRNWQAISMSGLVIFIKGHIDFLQFSIPIAVIFSLAVLKRINLYIPNPSLYISLLFLYIAVNFLTSENPQGWEFMATFSVMIVAAILLSSYSLIGIDFLKVTKIAFLTVAVTSVALNLSEYMLGYGYVPGIIRFFGTATHPNFIGVQMAVFSIVFVGQALEASGAKRAFFVIFAISSLFLIYCSGSRTALTVIAVGIFSIFASRSRPSVAIGIFFAILITVLIFILLGGARIPYIEIYDRSGGLSRPQVWGQMWDDILDAPMLGHGDLQRHSENSWLRGWAGAGVLYPLTLLAVSAGIVLEVFRGLSRGHVSIISIYVGVWGGLTAGSIFEGYLVDTNSLPIHAWFISLTIIALHLKLASTSAALDDSPSPRSERNSGLNRRFAQG